MYPFLRDDDLVVAREIPCERFKKGNLLIFRGKGGTYIIHRLIRKGKGDFFLLKGDGYNLSPELVEKRAILGKSIGIIRSGRFVRLNRSREWFYWGISYLREYFIRLRRRVIHGSKFSI